MKKVEINGQPGYLFESNGSFGKIKEKLFQLVMIKKDTVFIVTGTTLPEASQVLQNILKNSVLSFQITGE